MKYCDNCGTVLDDNVEYCGECGARQEIEDKAVQREKEQGKNAGVIIIMIIILFVLLIGGVFYWKYRQDPIEKTIKQKASIEIPDQQNETALKKENGQRSDGKENEESTIKEKEEETKIQFIGKVDEVYRNDSSYDAFIRIDTSDPDKVSIDMTISDIPYGTFYGKILSENLIQFVIDGGEKINLQWKDENHFIATPENGFTDESVQMANLMCICLNAQSYTIESQSESIQEFYASYMPAEGNYCNSTNGEFPHTCEIRIRQVTDHTFSFSIWEIIDENGNEAENKIFKEHTAVFESANATTAVYRGMQYTLYFDCSIYGEMMLSGFDMATLIGDRFYNMDML